MKYQEFYLQTISKLPVGTTLQNPGGGTSKITKYTNTHMVYKRGRSDIRVSMADLHAAYRTFLGKTVSSTDLREYAPRVFDSKRSGHSCNCTLLFMVLDEIGIVSTIDGDGKSGNPFRVTIPLPAKE